MGKTSLMERFVAAKFSSQYKATIGADFSTKDVTIGDEVVTLQIWDTAGQERYQSLGTAFYRGADACVLVYDVSEAASFQKLETWRNTFIQSADIKDPREYPFVVLGNKSDVEASKQVVQAAAVSQWCSKMGDIPNFLVRGMRPPPPRPLPPPLLQPTLSSSPPPTLPPQLIPVPRAQVSAKSGEGVDNGFITVVKSAAKRVRADEPVIPDTLNLGAVKPAEKSGGCPC